MSFGYGKGIPQGNNLVFQRDTSGVAEGVGHPGQCTKSDPMAKATPLAVSHSISKQSGSSEMPSGAF